MKKKTWRENEVYVCVFLANLESLGRVNSVIVTTDPTAL
jgi:hypothetical protein